MKSYQDSAQLIEARLINTFCTFPEAFETYNIDSNLFYYQVHSTIWNIIENVREKYKEFDLNKAVDMLNTSGVLEYFTQSVMDQVPSLAIIEDDIKYLDNLYKLRCAQAIIQSTYEYDELETELNNIQSYFTDSSHGELPSEEDIYNLVTTPSNSLKFKSWYMSQFDITPNTLNIIGARTGKGKTALSLNLAYELSENYCVIYFNLENPKEVIYQRLVSMDVGFSKRELRSLQSDEKKSKVMDSIYRLKSRDLKIYDSKDAPNLETIRKIIKIASKKQMVIVFIDNVNNVKSLKKFGSIREEINHVTKELLNLKASTNCIVFALAQLRRPEKDSNRPSERDLKESGSLEEDADNVFLLHEYEEFKDGKYFYQLFTPKSRNEANQETMVMFDKKVQKFMDPSIYEEQEYRLMRKEKEKR